MEDRAGETINLSSIRNKIRNEKNEKLNKIKSLLENNIHEMPTVYLIKSNITK